MASTNPHPYDTLEHTAWHRGYEGLIYLSDNPQMNAIYDAARELAILDCVNHGVSTSLDRRVINGHVYFVLVVNGHDVFKSMMVGVVENLKEALDTALQKP